MKNHLFKWLLLLGLGSCAALLLDIMIVINYSSIWSIVSISLVSIGTIGVGIAIIIEGVILYKNHKLNKKDKN